MAGEVIGEIGRRLGTAALAHPLAEAVDAVAGGNRSDRRLREAVFGVVSESVIRSGRGVGQDIAVGVVASN